MPNKQRSGGGGQSRQGRSGPSQNKSAKKANRQGNVPERTAQPRRTGRENETDGADRSRRESDAREDEGYERSSRSRDDESEFEREPAPERMTDREEDEEE